MPNFGVQRLFIEIKHTSSIKFCVDKHRRAHLIYRVCREISDLWQITQKCPISAFRGYSSRSSEIGTVLRGVTEIILLSVYILIAEKFLISGKSPRNAQFRRSEAIHRDQARSEQHL